MTTRDTSTAGAPRDLGASVLELLATQGKPMGVRDLVRRLGLDAPGRRDLKEVLRRLIEIGEVERSIRVIADAIARTVLSRNREQCRRHIHAVGSIERVG